MIGFGTTCWMNYINLAQHQPIWNFVSWNCTLQLIMCLSIKKNMKSQKLSDQACSSGLLIAINNRTYLQVYLSQFVQIKLSLRQMVRIPYKTSRQQKYFIKKKLYNVGLSIGRAANSLASNGFSGQWEIARNLFFLLLLLSRSNVMNRESVRRRL